MKKWIVSSQKQRQLRKPVKASKYPPDVRYPDGSIVDINSADDEVRCCFPKKKKVTSFTNSSKITRKYNINHHRFIAHISDIEDPYAMFDLQEVHAYDDAEYAWIKRISPTTAAVIRDGKRIDRIPLGDFDDEYEEEYADNMNQYWDDLFSGLCEELIYINRDVKPVMIHW